MSTAPSFESMPSGIDLITICKLETWYVYAMKVCFLSSGLSHVSLPFILAKTALSKWSWWKRPRAHTKDRDVSCTCIAFWFSLTELLCVCLFRLNPLALASGMFGFVRFVAMHTCHWLSLIACSHLVWLLILSRDSTCWSGRTLPSVALKISTCIVIRRVQVTMQSITEFFWYTFAAECTIIRKFFVLKNICTRVKQEKLNTKCF